MCATALRKLTAINLRSEDGVEPAVVSGTQVMTGWQLAAGLAALLRALFGTFFHERLSWFLLVRFLLLHALRHNVPPVMVKKITASTSLLYVHTLNQ